MTSIVNQVYIASGLLQEDLCQWMGPLGRRVAVVSDSTIAPLYAETLADTLQGVGYSVKLFVFPEGEKYKSRETVYALQDQMLDWGIDRHAAIIGIGGGVVTDVAGYVAATLLRGIEFISIPTTLLAMVDASIGGKTGVNTSHGKNLIGAFYSAAAVLIDPDVLKTLPQERLLEGVVEMVKHGIIADALYFETLIEHAKEILEMDPQTLETVIAKSCEIKSSVVEEDEQEKIGKRRILNFGHTIGHALELASDYTISHGNAVAIGMIAESELAVKMGILSSDIPGKLRSALSRFGIQTALPKEISKKTLLQAMLYDKKNKNAHPRFVMINGIGSCDSCGGNYCSEVKIEMLDDLCIDKTH